MPPGTGHPKGKVAQALDLGAAAPREDVEAPEVVGVDEVGPGVRVSRDLSGHAVGRGGREEEEGLSKSKVEECQYGVSDPVMMTPSLT